MGIRLVFVNVNGETNKENYRVLLSHQKITIKVLDDHKTSTCCKDSLCLSVSLSVSL